ncbi:MAG: penicillin-binding protein 1B, partial [Pseudomonadota bacterium]|nr:penicillin-binding protein 1B [Pseudomonadota bacterium]
WVFNFVDDMPLLTNTSPHQRGLVLISLILLMIALIAAIALGLYMIRLDSVVKEKFEGKRWEIPAKVYARPLELYTGATVNGDELKAELKLLNYRQADSYQAAGTWTQQDGHYYVHTRGFDYGDSQDPEQVLKIAFSGSQISDIQSTQNTGTGIARLEPVQIGGIYPRHNEDRVLVKLENVPQPLIDALIATEDRSFYSHHGISIRGTARAIVSNVTGGPRQGGSTLTQQLIKNFYLTSERTLKRKFNEALMAILLEMRYSKNDILEAYLNEINLGQNGNRSINGFGLASQFYFGQPLREIKLHQYALMVGLVKGPTQYNPWRNPKTSLERRNVVLNNMLVTGKISQDQYDEAVKKPLSILKTPTAGRTLYPDFLDVVKRHLAEQYQESDLRSEGLRIFSTLDPRVQNAADQAFKSSVNSLVSRNKKQLNGLQGAMLVANPQTGELLAAVGGSGVFTGYNRAVDARRQIGSLVKPAVFLTALQSERYSVVSPIDDGPISITGMGMKDWQPKNYDHRDHGIVPMYTALARSYNQATVRLGWEMGVPTVINTMRQLGVEAEIPNYPSVLLGAVNLTPMEVLSMYQVYAGGGFGHPPTAIRAVVNAQGRPLQRYGLSMRQRIDPSHAYLINYAMQQVVEGGTARGALNSLSADLKLAGKTGTTNDARDAWFAGYSGNYVSVVWLGHDDNRPIGLTGSSGALPVWTNLMKRLPLTPVDLAQPSNILWYWLDDSTGMLSAEGCAGAVLAPVTRRTVPDQMVSCAQQQYEYNQQDWSEPTLTPNNPLDTPDVPTQPTPTRPNQGTWLDRVLENF